MADVTTEVSGEFAALVLKAWQGEVYGVEVYGALAERRRSTAEASKLQSLVTLEEHMEQRLARLLITLDITPDLCDVLSVAEVDINALRSSSWAELMTWLNADAGTALSEYVRMLELAPTDPFVREVVVEVVAHERALMAFCEAELSGESESLAKVIALLPRDST